MKYVNNTPDSLATHSTRQPHNPQLKHQYPYLTRRNFGLDGIPLPVLLAARHRIPTIPAGRRVPAPGGHWTSMAGIQPESGPGQPRTISSSVL